MNVYQFSQALTAMMIQHSAGNLSDTSMAHGAAELSSLFSAQPESALTGLLEPRIVPPNIFQRIQTPALDIDKLLFTDGEVSNEGKIERGITANLLAWLEFNGWKAVEIDDGDEVTSVSSIKEAMELIFNLDEARVQVANKDDVRHGILLVLGNVVDIIADHSYAHGDLDGFNDVMSEFDAEHYAYTF
jgi:hypothetical protein